MGTGVSEIIDEIEHATSVVELVDLLQEAIESFGFASFSFVDAGRPHQDIPYFLSTTGENWEADYRTNGFVHVDPAISMARRSNAPFPWNRIPLPPRLGKKKPGAHLLMEAAADHGFKNGYVFPFHFVDFQGRVYSTVNGLFWKDEASKMEFMLNSEKRHELNLVMMYWTQRAIDLAGTKFREQSSFSDIPTNGNGRMHLSDREREVLTWAGRGLTVADTSEVLKISQETVQTHIQNCLARLGASNKIHAVAKAIKLCLIDL